MKIAIIAPSALPSPPPSYGGIEHISANTAAELAKMEHEVFLVTTNESPWIGVRDAVDEQGNKHGSLTTIAAGPTSWNAIGERTMYLNYHDWLEKEFGEGQGVVLGMSWWAYYYYSLTGAELKIGQNQSVKIARHPKMKICHSTQGMSNWVANNQYVAPPNVQFPRLLGISSAHAQYLSSCFQKPVRFVHNGIELPPYEPRPSEGFLLSLNRISKEKGIHNVIDVALETGIPTKLVGDDVHVSDQNYVFDIMDKCEKSGGLVEYIGSVENDVKWDYIKRCKALISCPDPNWIEAFGIMTIEGFSQGKPMISLANGGMKDTVIHGTNGFLCNNVSEIKQLLTMQSPNGAPLDLVCAHPEVIRSTAEKYSVSNMAREYLRICQGVLNNDPAYNW